MTFIKSKEGAPMLGVGGIELKSYTLNSYSVYIHVE